MILKGKTAFISGSSSGIGFGIAECMAQAGAKIFLHGIEDVAVLESRARQIREKHSAEVKVFSVNLGDPKAVLDFCGQSVFSEIDILVNNAGIQHVSPIETFPLEKWNLVLQLHLSTPFLLMRQILPKMRERGWGRVISVASVHGQVASQQKAAYVSAKHGVIGLTKVAALETAGSGITVNAICPGWVRTALVEAQIATKAKEKNISVEAAARELLAEKQPSLKFTEPSDIGAMAVFLCSTAGNNLTGQSLTIDGGWTAQ